MVMRYVTPDPKALAISAKRIEVFSNFGGLNEFLNKLEPLHFLFFLIPSRAWS
jgi:hypothetical protein